MFVFDDRVYDVRVLGNRLTDPLTRDEPPHSSLLRLQNDCSKVFDSCALSDN